MEVIRSISELQNALHKIRSANKVVGFVPTMGALHKGHLTLVQQAHEECQTVVVSIFVNPTQFNNKDDYEKYPRLFEKDIEKLQQEKTCDFVFLPSVEEMYPEPDTRHFDLGYLEEIMEGKFRPGHFQGVAQIVSKLFDMVKPDKAYFGKKDFQQVAVIKRLVEILHVPVEIIPCEIVREPHGLAMSSRNMRLSNEDFQQAKIIYQTLKQIPQWLKQYSIEKTKITASEFIQKTVPFKTEYVEIVDSSTLLPIKDISLHKSITCCVAVFCNDVRLIDNIEIIL
jgi:pantoate--beta-alanine ligase